MYICVNKEDLELLGWKFQGKCNDIEEFNKIYKLIL